MAFILAVLLSFIPAFLYATVIYWLDRYEKEPKLLLAGSFAWGAIVATAGALIISIVLEAGVQILTGSQTLTELAGGSIIAPVVEESLKGLAVLIIFLVFRKEFDSVLDGIAYAGITALGFAATENVLYLYFMGYQEEGMAGLWTLFFLRVLLGGWNHAVFTAFIGIGLALSRLSRSLPVKLLAPVVGWFIAVSVHGLHNTMAVVLGTFFDMQGLIATILVDWVGWLVMLGIVVWAIYREKSWMATYLLEEVDRGVITRAHYDTACSSWARASLWVRGLVLRRAATARRFYQLCAEMAQKKHHFATLGDEQGNTAIIEKLRGEMRELATKL